jgi:ABC-type sulfate transport system substrate-binding protein
MSTKMELNVLETVGDSPLDAITDDNNAEKIATTKILGKVSWDVAHEIYVSIIPFFLLKKDREESSTIFAILSFIHS